MTGIRKSLGLALTMIIVLSLVGPQGASASLGSFHSESGSGTTFLTFTPHGINQLETQGGTIKCSTFGGKTSYSGTTTTELTISSISYGGCIAFGLTAHIDTMGCTYTLTGGKIFANFQIVCPTTAGGVTDEITITPTQGGVSVCHVDIPEQSTIAAVYNVGTPPRDVEIAFPSPTIKYTITYFGGGGFKCGTAGAHSDGTENGIITAEAFRNAAHSEITGFEYL